MIARLNFFLVAILLASSFWLIRASDEARGLFADLERAQEREKELDVEYDRLKVDRRKAATPLVIEDMVRRKLGMFNADPAVTHYVNGAPLLGAKSGAASGAASQPAVAGGQP